MPLAGLRVEDPSPPPPSPAPRKRLRSTGGRLLPPAAPRKAAGGGTQNEEPQLCKNSCVPAKRDAGSKRRAARACAGSRLKIELVYHPSTSAYHTPGLFPRLHSCALFFIFFCVCFYFETEAGRLRKRDCSFSFIKITVRRQRRRENGREEKLQK